MPASSAVAITLSTPSMVRVHERDVFTIRVPRAGQAAAERARSASQALGRVAEEPELADARVEEQGQLAVVFVGKTPIVTLDEEDAVADGGLTLHVHAASTATRIQEALRLERKRSAIATAVFSFSLLIFSALMAVLLLQRMRLFEEKLRAWMDTHPDRLPALGLGKIEVASPAAVHGAMGIALRIGHRLAQATIVYVWLLFALSLFDATHGYTEKLSGFVLAPLSALMNRAGAALPVLVIGGIAAVVIGLVLRFVGLFFGSVARGETKLGWLPKDLAGPTSVLVRAGVVITALVLAAPLISGSDEGALSHAGVAALATLVLACAPVLACIAVGVPIVFGRRLRIGDFVEAGARTGRVRGVTLLELRLEDPWGCEVRVPHLLGLWHSTRLLGRSRMVTVDVAVDAAASQTKVRELLLASAGTVSSRARVELLSLDIDGARYRVSCPENAGADLAVTIANGLREGGVALGRSDAGHSDRRATP